MYGYVFHVDLCRVMYSHVDLCMVMYGHVHLCRVMFNRVDLFRVMYGHVDLCMVMYGHVVLYRVYGPSKPTHAWQIRLITFIRSYYITNLQAAEAHTRETQQLTPTLTRTRFKCFTVSWDV